MVQVFWQSILIVALMTVGVGQCLAHEESEQIELKDNAALWYWMAFAELPGHDDPAYQIIQDWETAPIEQLQFSDDWPVVQYFHRGVEYERCVWGVDIKRDGPFALLPHLVQAPNMAKVVMARARVFMELGEVDKALKEVSAVMTFARHVGSDGMIIGVLIQSKIELMTREFLAEHLHQLNHEQLIMLKKHIALVPEYNSMVSAVESERQMLDWWIIKARQDGMEAVYKLINEYDEEIDYTKHISLIKVLSGNTVEGFVALVEDCRSYYDQVEEVMKAEPKQIRREDNKYEQAIVQADNPLIIFTPAAGAARLTEAYHQTVAAILDAMIEYRIGGMEAFNKVTDPYDGQPFEILKRDEGLVVRSRWKPKEDLSLELVFTNIE